MNNQLHTIKLSFAMMLANKSRTALTMLGIIIGIASVIIVYSAGEGIYSLVLGQVESFGTDIVQTEIRLPSAKQKGNRGQTESASAMAMGVQVTSLTLEDMEAGSKSANVKDAYAGLFSQEQVSYQGNLKKAFVFGVSPSYTNIDVSKVESGRFFTDAEDRSLAQVAVIGKKIRDKLFGDNDPIGRFITIRKEKFLIIGVMESRGAVMFMDFDDYVYLPIRSLQKKLMGIDHVSMIVHQLKDVAKGEDTAEEIRYIIRQNHGISDPDKDDFRTVTMVEALSTMKTVTGAITLLLLAIVAISLIVGGVGIMNIMYVIVTERTSEIGLRKAVGANFQQIMVQFLIESALITLIGGIIGIVLGILVSWLIALGARAWGLDWSFIIPLRAYGVSLLFSLIFGILFGLFPARRAAKLDPIEALRAEQ